MGYLSNCNKEVADVKTELFALGRLWKIDDIKLEISNINEKIDEKAETSKVEKLITEKINQLEKKMTDMFKKVNDDMKENLSDINKKIDEKAETSKVEKLIVEKINQLEKQMTDIYKKIDEKAETSKVEKLIVEKNKSVRKKD